MDLPMCLHSTDFLSAMSLSPPPQEVAATLLPGGQVRIPSLSQPSYHQLLDFISVLLSCQYSYGIPDSRDRLSGS